MQWLLNFQEKMATLGGRWSLLTPRCMFVCVHACMCVYVCVHPCKHVHVHVFMQTQCATQSVSLYTYIGIHVYNTNIESSNNLYVFVYTRQFSLSWPIPNVISLPTAEHLVSTTWLDHCAVLVVHDNVLHGYSYKPLNNYIMYIYRIAVCASKYSIIHMTLDPEPVGLIVSEKLPIASTWITVPCWTTSSMLEPIPVRLLS